MTLSNARLWPLQKIICIWQFWENMTMVLQDFKYLHQALLVAISNRHTFGLKQLLAIDELKNQAHANQNEALVTAINSGTVEAVKILLALHNVRENAQNLNSVTRQKLKTLLQSEHQTDCAHEALSIGHNALRFQERKSNSSYFTYDYTSEEAYSILKP
jgi:hypothetical protein